MSRKSLLSIGMSHGARVHRKLPLNKTLGMGSSRRPVSTTEKMYDCVLRIMYSGESINNLFFSVNIGVFAASGQSVTLKLPLFLFEPRGDQCRPRSRTVRPRAGQNACQPFFRDELAARKHLHPTASVPINRRVVRKKIRGLQGVEAVVLWV